MSKAQKFAIGFILVYFVFVFSFMRKVEMDRPLSASIRWIPLACIVFALIVVARLSRRPDHFLGTRDGMSATPKRTRWPVMSMLALYVITISTTLAGMATGQLPWRFAIP